MKYFITTLIFLISAHYCIAQSNILREFNSSIDQDVYLEFDEASIVSITEWPENYISLEARVSINDNTQNQAYEIIENTSDGQLSIEGFIKNKESLPQVIRIKKGDEIYTFQTDVWDSPEIQEFIAHNGDDGIQWKSIGISWDIRIEIKIPKKRNLVVHSTHGMIELHKLSGKVQANSKHGGIDATISDNANIDAKTKWGNIYSNVTLDINQSLSSDDGWNHVVGMINNGGGSVLDLESKHANIYLRQ